MTDAITAIGLVASIASLVLAVVAIWLSVVFYKLANAQAEASAKNAQEITTGISRLEKVFDGLYSDTFSIMKETVTDMRRHIWHRDGSVSQKAPPSDSPLVDPVLTKELIDPFVAKLEELSTQLGIADDKIETLRQRLTPVVMESAERAQTPAARVRAAVLQVLARQMEADRGGLPLSALSRSVRRRLAGQQFDDLESLVVDALFDLRQEGEIYWDGPDAILHSTSLISLAGPNPAESPRE